MNHKVIEEEDVQDEADNRGNSRWGTCVEITRDKTIIILRVSTYEGRYIRDNW
jgi:hypothetical protein